MVLGLAVVHMVSWRCY